MTTPNTISVKYLNTCKQLHLWRSAVNSEVLQVLLVCMTEEDAFGPLQPTANSSSCACSAVASPAPFKMPVYLAADWSVTNLNSFQMQSLLMLISFPPRVWNDQAVVREPRRLQAESESRSEVLLPVQDHLWQHRHHGCPQGPLQRRLKEEPARQMLQPPAPEPVGLEGQMHRWDTTGPNFLNLEGWGGY